jgi:hypothetical protein
MKISQKLTTMAVMVCTAAYVSTMVRAETAGAQAPEVAALRTTGKPAQPKTNKHLKLCAQLGLKVGLTYEFMVFNNEEVHYWTIRSLGARGWILVKDSRYPETWLNLSQDRGDAGHLQPDGGTAEKAEP